MQRRSQLLFQHQIPPNLNLKGESRKCLTICVAYRNGRTQRILIRVRVSSHWRGERNRLCLMTLSVGISFAILLIKTTATTTKQKDQKQSHLLGFSKHGDIFKTWMKPSLFDYFIIFQNLIFSPDSWEKREIV